MKFIVALLAFASFASCDIISDLDAFYDQSVIDANNAFMQLFNAKSNALSGLAQPLRSAYASYQQTVAAFPVNRLMADTRQRFTEVTNTADLWLSRGVHTAEVDGLNALWPEHPNGGRVPPLPSELFMESVLRFHVTEFQSRVTMHDPICIEPFIPQIIPSLQPATDAVVAAALDLVPTLPQRFPLSDRDVATSVAASRNFETILNACASAPEAVTDTCFRNFLISQVDCQGCRFFDPLMGPFFMIPMESSSIAGDYGFAKRDQTNMILMNNQVMRDISACPFI
ncbi:CLUMA_CG007722, isoform B [Clunio marinus]|uniref:CLUMA_CG007722, isoform B n=1 Tax=Clunio marinus TaxID=568069 RepID=A0A1J1I1I9_9DIPT|nr:CLUMA_CG007722, isoform B [Clunio marinus]